MVLADGVFDPVHVGHLAYLDAAREIGKPLMVRVAGDDAIFEKGRVPFQTQRERLMTVLSLAPVDCACVTDTLAEAVLQYTPTHLVKGMDWKDKLPEDVEAACLLTGTEIVFVNTPSRSSSERLAS